MQGVTEFLPVSSSAHLILARAFFGWDAEQFGLPFDVACHVGTLAALLIYYRHDVTGMLAAVPQMAKPANSPAARLAWLLVVGTIPVVLGGLFLNDWISNTMRTPAVAAVSLAVGAGFFLFVERMGLRHRDVGGLTVWDALAVGCAQALALVPGVSRSGATITMGMVLGLRRDSSARFAFLLGIPAVLAAAAHEALPVMDEIQSPEGAQLFLLGTVVSGLVGYVVIKYLIRYLTRHSLDAFAYYRLELAAATGLWMLLIRN